MNLDKNLPIHVQRSWYHLLIAIFVPAILAAVLGFGGARIAGAILKKFIEPRILQPIIFMGIFCWFFWRTSLPRFKNWFWSFNLTHEKISLTTFWKKQVSFAQSEITYYDEAPPFVFLTRQNQKLKININIFPKKEQLTVPFWLVRWLPNTALPTTIQENFEQRKHRSEEIDSFKSNVLHAKSDKESLRGLKFLSFITFFLFAGLGIFLTSKDTSINAISHIPHLNFD